MGIPRALLTALVVMLVAAVVFVGIRRVTTDDTTDSPPAGGIVAETGCGLPVEHYDEDTLHRAYEMTRRMSEPDVAPMWDDEQLRLSLTDPRFVAELERHFCQMQSMLAE